MENFSPDQLFWVAKDSGDACQAISTSGEVSEVDCAETLPGLCTQSAPVSTAETNDDPTDYHIDHAVGSSVYTGFRDHFVFKFRGIRFAAQPPRFSHATLHQPEGTEPIPALKAGANCLQAAEEASGSSEDCLFLNIWTPTLPPKSGVPKDKLKPVMFYIYGGAFTSGSSKNTNTDGTNLASRGDVVSIASNYRVSTLGFLSLNDGVHDGNYALSDVITALEWVQQNAESFGGDPERVTIFGESAGAGFVRALLAAPKAQGLFSNAISQSGPAGLSVNEHGLSAYLNSVEYEYEHTTLPVLNATGCADAEDVLGCLRDFDGAELVGLDAIAANVVQDGTYMTTSHLPLDGSGVANDVVVMSGTNRDELGVDLPPLPEGTTIDDALAMFQAVLGVDARPLLDSGVFPLPEDPAPDDLVKWLVRVATDGVYTCMETATNHAAAQTGAYKELYSFEFNRTFSPRGYTQPHCDAPATEEFPDGDAEKEYMKCHAGEQMIVFGTILRAGLPDRDGLDVPFMQLVVDYWSAFAHGRDPNPDEGYLVARGYTGTLAQVGSAGRWEA
ncbi:MAG: carboxylesterase family protein, partial [Acidobacteria bacterium]|nr:carboxylesterase family protein [Acidobacteriota bacterium]